MGFLGITIIKITKTKNMHSFTTYFLSALLFICCNYCKRGRFRKKLSIVYHTLFNSYRMCHWVDNYSHFFGLWAIYMQAMHFKKLSYQFCWKAVWITTLNDPNLINCSHWIDNAPHIVIFNNILLSDNNFKNPTTAKNIQTSTILDWLINVVQFY